MTQRERHARRCRAHPDGSLAASEGTKGYPFTDLGDELEGGILAVREHANVPSRYPFGRCFDILDDRCEHGVLLFRSPRQRASEPLEGIQTQADSLLRLLGKA